MPSLTVWLYPSAFGAGSGELHLRTLQERGQITVHDAATITWMPHDPEPRVRPVEHLTGRSAGRGAFWGSLVGLVLLNPLAGAAAGAGVGAAVQRARSAGLDGEFVDSVRERLSPGTSALVLLSSDADLDAVRGLMRRNTGVLLHADLSPQGVQILEQLHLPAPRGSAEGRGGEVAED